jgi:hypothetical protein
VRAEAEIRDEAIHQAAMEICWLCRTSPKHGHNPVPVKDDEGWWHSFWVGNGRNMCSAGPIWAMKERDANQCPDCKCLKTAHHGPTIGCEGAGGSCGCERTFA